MQGFKITSGKGFHITFENGWTVSIQFGYGNYGDNYRNSGMYRKDHPEYGDCQSSCAEVAVWPATGDMVELEDGCTVVGYKNTAEVLAIINQTAARQPQEVKK